MVQWWFAGANGILTGLFALHISHKENNNIWINKLMVFRIHRTAYSLTHQPILYMSIERPFHLIDTIGSFSLLSFLFRSRSSLCSLLNVCWKLIILWHLLTSHEIGIRWAMKYLNRLWAHIYCNKTPKKKVFGINGIKFIVWEKETVYSFVCVCV